MFKNILCPIDRSPSSLQAFDRAIALARWQGARLHLLQVIESVAPPGGRVGVKHAGLHDETRAALDKDLRQMLVSRRASDVKVEIVLREGNVVREILAQARDSRADLVVIGSHGSGGVHRLVLGSVAEKVLRQATCPVLTIRRGVSRVRRNRSPIRTILCPTDLSAAGNNAVAYAKRLSRAADARLIVMSAVEWPFGVAVTPGRLAELQDELEANTRKALARLLPRPGSDRPAAKAIVVHGKGSAAIVKLARARSADLIVMGVSGRGALDVVLLGSTTHQVIRRGEWPVLTVPPAAR
jgi:nucleotide-binding universal stress UspA family protein